MSVLASWESAVGAITVRVDRVGEPGPALANPTDAARHALATQPQDTLRALQAVGVHELRQTGSFLQLCAFEDIDRMTGDDHA